MNGVDHLDDGDIVVQAVDAQVVFFRLQLFSRRFADGHVVHVPEVKKEHNKFFIYLSLSISFLIFYFEM